MKSPSAMEYDARSRPFSSTLPWKMSLMPSASQPSAVPISDAAASSFTLLTSMSGAASTENVTPLSVFRSTFIALRQQGNKRTRMSRQTRREPAHTQTCPQQRGRRPRQLIPLRARTSAASDRVAREASGRDGGAQTAGSKKQTVLFLAWSMSGRRPLPPPPTPTHPTTQRIRTRLTHTHAPRQPAADQLARHPSSIHPSSPAALAPGTPGRDPPTHHPPPTNHLTTSHQLAPVPVSP
eukprot:scaffold14773_cov106-Isochrysis_galbana.AAC.1